jgi:hypothetical protein
LPEGVKMNDQCETVTLENFLTIGVRLYSSDDWFLIFIKEGGPPLFSSIKKLEISRKASHKRQYH